MHNRLSLRAAASFFAIGIYVIGPAMLQAQSTTPSQATSTKQQSDLQSIIREAAAQYQLPEAWITEVIRAESNGNAKAVSPKGAKGLMQIMPGTWAYLRRKLRIGTNPFAVRDNVMAGSAYLRELYDRFGFPGCLAAYNAGPGRYSSYVKGKRGLPRETVNYVSIITSRLGRRSVSLGGGKRKFSIKAAARPSASALFVRTSNAIDEQTDGMVLDSSDALSAQREDTMPSIFVTRPRPAVKP